MRSNLVPLILRLHGRIEALQIAMFRAVLEQPAFRTRLRWTLVAVLLFSAAITLSASAEDSLLQLNAIDAKFQALQNTWYTVVKGFAVSLFWKLALIDFAWSTVVYVLEKNEAAEILTSLVRKIITLSFFFTLLKLSNTWIPAIIQSFVTIGKAASGVGPLTPDGIVNKGLDLAMGAFTLLKELSTVEAIGVVFPVSFMAILIFLAFLWVAAQLLVNLVESYIAIGLGVILLGFGGSRWTTDFATKYLQFAVGTGVKLMLIYAIIGGGQTLFGGLQVDPDQLLKSCMIVLGVSFIYTYLAINIPQLATAMMSGSPNLTAGGLAGAAATVASAAVGAGVAAAGAGSAAMGGMAKGAAGAGGLSQALGAGLNSAADHGKTGMAAAGHALGEVASHGMGLAAGSAGGGLQNARAAFADRAAQTAGGKIATSIEASRGGSVAGAPAPAPVPAPGAQANPAGGQGATGGAGVGAAPSPDGAATGDGGGQADVAGQGGAEGGSGDSSQGDTAASAGAAPAPAAAPAAASSASTAPASPSTSSAPSAPSAPSGHGTTGGQGSAPASSAAGPAAPSAPNSGEAPLPSSTPADPASSATNQAPAPAPAPFGAA